MRGDEDFVDCQLMWLARAASALPVQDDRPDGARRVRADIGASDHHTIVRAQQLSHGTEPRAHGEPDEVTARVDYEVRD